MQDWLLRVFHDALTNALAPAWLLLLLVHYLLRRALHRTGGVFSFGKKEISVGLGSPDPLSLGSVLIDVLTFFWAAMIIAAALNNH